MITSECCAYCIYRFGCEDYNEEDANQMICNSFVGEEKKLE